MNLSSALQIYDYSDSDGSDTETEALIDIEWVLDEYEIDSDEPINIKECNSDNQDQK